MEEFQKVCEEEIKIMVNEVKILKKYSNNNYKGFAFSPR
jgi:hypothetical protein